jgi:hypothetical protein
MTLTPKQIGRAAGRIFQSSIPVNWAYRCQEDQEDYGVDAEIEIIGDNEKATGFIFKAQIKGQENVSIINGGSITSFSLSTERLNYYMNQLDVPIILVVVDVTTKKVYWISLQDDQNLSGRLAIANGEGKKNITIHIPCENNLPDGSNELIRAVKDNMTWMKINSLNKINTPINQMLKNSPTKLIDDLIQRNKEFNFYLYIEQYERLLKSKSYKELFNKAKITFDSSSELFDTRFNSAIYIEQVYIHALQNEELKDEHLFNLYNALIGLVRSKRKNGNYRMYVVFLMRSFIIDKLIETDYHAVITKKNTSHDELTSWMLNHENDRIATATASHVQKTISSINKMVLQGNDNFFTDAISRVAIKLGVYAQRLKIDERIESSKYLFNWIDYCLDLAMEICKVQENEALYGKFVLIYATVSTNRDDYGKCFHEAREKLEFINDEDIKFSLNLALEKIAKHKTTFMERSDPDSEIDFFTSRAKQMGFKIDDPEDVMGRIIKQGLLDYNPERVIKNCEHLIMIASRSVGIPAMMVGLYSAAMKYLVCLKKNHVMGGWRLDEIYNSKPLGGFQSEFCKDCQDCKPRSPEWKWTSAWQEEQIELHKDLTSRLERW